MKQIMITPTLYMINQQEKYLKSSKAPMVSKAEYTLGIFLAVTVSLLILKTY